MKKRDPRYDPQKGDVIRDPDGFYIYVTGRTPRHVFTETFGDCKPMLWCTRCKLGFWRKKAMDCDVAITVLN